jgi:Cd2+/Zn2+-exporting ATPase
VGEAVGRAVGADVVHAEQLPEGKVRVIEEMRRVHGRVAMVGDGINDAPALAAADVGVAMGAAASPLAIETADMAVLGEDVSVVAYGVRLARATMRTIGINVAFALGIKVVFLGLAIAGHTSMWLAILADTGASLIVVTHALRLLRVR